MSVPQGSEVKWKWGSSTASGKVTEIHCSTLTRSSKGSEITRHGSDHDHDHDHDPAYVIEQEDGTIVLKLRSEVEHA